MVAFKINRPDYAGVMPAGGKPLGDRPLGGKPARSARRRVLIGGQFHSVTSTYQVAIRNISTTGALIQADTAFTRGVAGVLNAPGLDRLCTVVWSRGRLHGLAFDEPLHPTVVLGLHGVTREDVAAAERETTRDWFEHKAR